MWLQLALTGLCVAVIPFCIVFLSKEKNKHRKLIAVSVALTFELIMFGAFTRLTDSGLGCPDWPGCYGNASPVGAHAAIAAAQSAMPTGPVTSGKAWVEMIHRYLATSVGVLILVLAVVAWLGRSAGGRNMQVQPISPWWPTMTLLWVCIQGAFGALTVTMKLFPAIVTLHLLGGLVLLALLCVQAVQFAQLEGKVTPVALSPALRWLLGLSFVLLVLQAALGAWVSTNYAVLACTDFPKCQSSWWPLMDFSEGFELWRPLGFTAAGEYIGFAALTAIHYVHRLMAFLVLALLGVLAWRLNRMAALRNPSRWIAALVGLQLATGLSNVVLDWPLLAAVLHTGGAGALVLVLTWTVAASRTGSSARAPVVPDFTAVRQTA